MIALALAAALLPTTPVLAQAATPAPAASAASAARAEPRFDLLVFAVEGDSVLGADAIERVVYPFLGPDKTVADAEAARKALEKAYQDAGFLSVNVLLPPQQLDASGELRLQVVQAAMAQLRVTGTQYTRPGLVREALPALTPGQVPNFNEMQQELAAYSRSSADREFTPLISAGEQPGTMAVEIKVAESLPLHASVELNSKQSLNTAAGRLESELRYDNLFQRGHALGLNWLVSPTKPEQANIPSLSYQLPLGGPGDRLVLAWMHSNSNTPTALGGGTVSRGTTGRLRWRDELASRDGLNHALTWGLTLRRLQDINQNVAGFTTESPPLHYSTLGLGYELDLSGPTLGAVPGRSLHLQVDVTAGLGAWNGRTVDCNGTPKDPFDCKRSGASPSFQTVGASLSATEPLGRWQLMLRLQGQLADAPLVPSEQVVVGGQDSVRGYYEGEQAGDLGLALRTELAAPSWQPLAQLTLRPLAFVDLARVLKTGALASEIRSAKLASTGLSLRADTPFGLQATLSWARVLKTTLRVDSNGSAVPLSGDGTGRQQRWDFSLRQHF